MKEITLSFTPEEYRELAKLVTLGSWFIMGADDYPVELMEEVKLKICTHGYVQLPGSDAFTRGGEEGEVFRDAEFAISDKLFDECEVFEEAYKKREFLEFLSCQMADRDFFEQYGKLEVEEVIKNPEFMGFLLEKQTEYRQQFMFNGVDNLRVVKK